MIAYINFEPSNFVYSINDKGQNWHGPCTSNSFDYGESPLRGDVTFLDRLPAELTITRRKNGALNSTFMAAGLDERVEAMRAEGHPCNSDAYLLRHWPKSEHVSAAVLGISVALEEPKFSHYQRFMERHIGRANIGCQLQCDFYGFHEPFSEIPNLPTVDEFRNGSPYFITSEHKIIFFSKPNRLRNA
jgi:hypothetical protein